MKAEAATTLLLELRARGARVRLASGRIRITPPSALTPELQSRIASLRFELIAAIEDPVALAEDAGWGDLASADDAKTTKCYACGGTDFWALRHLSNWVCGGCHAPDFSLDEIRWLHVSVRPDRSTVGSRSIGCAACRGSGFNWVVGGMWTVCARCNSGADRDAPEDQPAHDRAEGGEA